MASYISTLGGMLKAVAEARANTSLIGTRPRSASTRRSLRTNSSAVLVSSTGMLADMAHVTGWTSWVRHASGAGQDCGSCSAAGSIQV